MLKALRRYAKTESIENQESENLPKSIHMEPTTQKVPPIIWETGNVSQIRSLLVLREAELLLAKAQLTGDKYRDWSVRNHIRDLETNITTLKRWLKEAVENDKDLGA